MLDVLSTPFVGTHELRRKLTKLLNQLRDERREFVITQQGKPIAILSDMEAYLEMKQAIREFSDPAYLAELLRAKRQIRSGKGILAKKVFAKRGI